MKEIELYLDMHYLETAEGELEQSPEVYFFFRDKVSQSGFPIVFKRPVAEILIEAAEGQREDPLSAFLLINKLISYGAIKLIKATICKFDEGRCWTNLHFLVNGEERVESVNTLTALEAATRSKVPIMIPEDVFLEAIESSLTKDAFALFQKKEDEI